jgi:TolA-binding protein
MFANRKLYRSSLIYVDEILRQYPASSWVPKALLLRGRCLQQLGDEEGAADAWQRLVDNFPDHPATLHARAGLHDLGRSPGKQAPEEEQTAPEPR